MQFIQTDIGLVNLAFVEQIQRAKDGKAILRMNSGSTIASMHYEEIEELLDPVIPNTTAAQALFMESVDGEVKHWFEPIIAWRLSSVRASPIVASGVECSYVLLPDGQVDQPFVATFDNLDAAKEAFLRESNP